ncbi:MAG: hypothetical protein OIF36_02270 [Alphaproteobacteria bacterium]|nr:hypothetical protein [Alphaproteobacteria bacterium]
MNKTRIFKKIYVIISVIFTTFIMIPAFLLMGAYEETYIKNKEYFLEDKLVDSDTFYKNNQKGYSTIKEYYKSGELKSHNIYLNTLCDNKTGYYKSGQIEFTHSCKNGELDGKYIEYYENGNLKYEANLINGETNGLVIWYNEDGKIKRSEEHKNNMKNGEEKINL